jgi:hypothetical protein
MNRMRLGGVTRGVVMVMAVVGVGAVCFAQSASGVATPGCEGVDARGCLARALDAMGGREKLASIKTAQLDVIGHTELMEQSYRQAPFITSYAREQVVMDLAGPRLIKKEHSVWPESDLKQADADFTLIVTPEGGVVRRGDKDGPCGAANLDAARETLALGPLHVLLTAEKAEDLRFGPAEMVRSTMHAVLAFTWSGVPVRVLVNPFNHLPDAVETTEEFRDFWFYWGDVEQRVDFDNWRWVEGVEYPSNQVTERNSVVWNSTQAVDIAFNGAVDEKDFAMDAKVAAMSAGMTGFKGATFGAAQDKPLAEGIDLFLGSWNATVVKQADGVVILETPISGKFTEGILAEAKKRYPDAAVKAVLSTSDSWPHVGGVREDVAEGLPVYVLDLNEPLVNRMVRAPHTIDPDPEETAKKTPVWKIVSGKTEIGTGPNRMVLYPLRGASTERQYMVYFPERRLLYASDTLVVNDDHTIYDPELTHEVEQAVERERLVVDTVYAMHQAPVAWSEVVKMLERMQQAIGNRQ